VPPYAFPGVTQEDTLPHQFLQEIYEPGAQDDQRPTVLFRNNEWQETDDNSTPTESNAIAVHTIFKSVMACNDGAETLYCPPADCEIFLIDFFEHSFTFQPTTVTSRHTLAQRQPYR
jgi:hypothetical protein